MVTTNFISNRARILGVWLLLCIVCGFGGYAFADNPDTTALKAQGKAFAAMAKKAKDAVVFIEVEKVLTTTNQMGQLFQFNEPFDPFGDDFLKKFFGQNAPGTQPREQPQQQYKQQAAGSGFIISKDGDILSNNHVVGGTDKIKVRLADGREFSGKIIGTDVQTDVAVIKIDADNLSVLALGNSDALEVGEWVMAIGSPFGLTQSVTVGVVSAKGRSNVGISDYEDFIQTDAAINPGNSGGPLLNMDGEVIGINTAIATQTGGYMGVGFAIPVNMVKQIYPQLIAHGEVTRSYLGVVIQELNSELAKSFSVTNAQGVVVSEVVKDSPAASAGLKVGDIIVEFNGQPIAKMEEFRNTIALTTPGTKVTLTIIRKGERQEIAVTLQKVKSKKMAAAPSGTQTSHRIGLEVQDLTADLAKRFGYVGDKGVIVSSVEPGSPAAAAGLTPGALIMEVEQQPVTNVNEFKKLIEESLDKTSILLLVKQNDASHFVVLNLGK